jgi:membrane associated rhomboid family serine protease
VGIKKYVLNAGMLLIFPVIISAVMLLPGNIQEALKLNLQNPKFWQFLTSGFVHNSASHYFDNLVAFIILILLQIILINRLKLQKSYSWLLFFTIISFPIISSIVKILLYPSLMPMVKISCGSSGIVSSLAGFIPMVWIAYLSKASRKNLCTVSFFGMVLSYIVLSFVIAYFSYHRNLFLTLIIIAIIVVFTASYKKSIKYIARTIAGEKNRLMLFYLLLLLLFFLSSPLLTFPLRLIQGNNSVDFFAHYLGFIYGFFISFVFFRLNN